jgi:7-cyano-7-deazaguanine synthase
VPHSTAVLFSGGLDSAVLLAQELAQHGRVQPIHVRCGFAWEDAEARAIARLLQSPPFAGRVAPAVTLSVDLRDVYPAAHWAIRGTPPAYDTPDEDVYLEGRNIVLISKAAVLCGRLGIDRLAIGTLSGNPFPDAKPEFLDAISCAMSLGLARPFAVVAPFSTLHKEDVVRIGRSLGVPLELTVSCMNPGPAGTPCGHCSKCRERDDAFRVADGLVSDSSGG